VTSPGETAPRASNDADVEFAQDRVMDHDTLVGFTKVHYT